MSSEFEPVPGLPRESAEARLRAEMRGLLGKAQLEDAKLHKMVNRRIAQLYVLFCVFLPAILLFDLYVFGPTALAIVCLGAVLRFNIWFRFEGGAKTRRLMWGRLSELERETTGS